MPATRIENVDVPFVVGKAEHFCTTSITPVAHPTRSGHSAGWVYALDADTGVWKWRLKSNYPIQSGMTPTGGARFLGDMRGNFYALDATNGQRLWGEEIGGAIGGGGVRGTHAGFCGAAVLDVSQRSTQKVVDVTYWNSWAHRRLPALPK